MTSNRGGGCAGLALDAKNNILFAAYPDKKNMIILSATDGKILTDLPIGAGCDGATFNRQRWKRSALRVTVPLPSSRKLAN